MKLLDRKDAESKIKRDNDELIVSNIRLRKLWQDITNKLNTVRENYEPEKIKKLQEFERFCKDILEKKAKLLEELAGIEKAIKEKKEIYWGIISKQDALEEKIYQVREQERKLDMREAFIEELERKQRELTSK